MHMDDKLRFQHYLLYIGLSSITLFNNPGIPWEGA